MVAPGISSNSVGPGATVSPQAGMQIPVMVLVDSSGNFVTSGAGTTGSPGVSRIEDGSSTNLATILANGAQLVARGSTTASVSLNAVVSNGNGTAVDLGSAYSNLSFVVTTTGSPSGGTVTLSVSVDGVTYVASGATATVGSAPATSTLSNVAYRYARLDLSGLTGGTSPSVTAKIMGS